MTQEQRIKKIEIVRDNLWNKVIVERTKASGASAHLYLERLYEHSLYSLEWLLFPLPQGVRRRLKVSSKLRQ